jgi:hypothetical protein
MYPCAQANRGRPAAILIGCALAGLPLVSASAQVVGSKVPIAAASSRDSQPDAQIVRDRWDASKVDTAATDANRSAVTAPSAAPAGSGECAQQYVAQKLELWQERLKLSDWRITWAMAHRSDLKPSTVGQIHWDKPSKNAAILVLDPSDYKMPFNAMLDDMEMTIIHELVHLKLTSLPHSEASRGSEEEAVNGLSEALFALEHQKP